MSRGTVGHTTFGFVAASIVATGGTVTAFATGQPYFALASMVLPYIPCLAYQRMTWQGVEKNPDAAMTADADFVMMATTRLMAAKNMTIVHEEPPVVGTSTSMVMAGSAVTANAEMGHD